MTCARSSASPEPPADGVLPSLARRIREELVKDFGPELVAHDLSHLDRVWRLARTIRAEEGDLEVIGAEAYLHDLHRLAEQRGAREESGALARAALARAGARLREDMPTGAGRALAEERHADTAGFLERLEREWAAG